MENATKALLIAAAILIAIVLVSIGVFVLRQGQDAMDSVDMSESQILSFNANFKSYEGLQRGSQVKALLQRIKTSNKKAAAGDNSTVINFNGGSINNADDNVETGAYYKVTFGENNNTGLINEVTIQKQ